MRCKFSNFKNKLINIYSFEINVLQQHEIFITLKIKVNMTKLKRNYNKNNMKYKIVVMKINK